jgi:hypothetical protein
MTSAMIIFIHLIYAYIITSSQVYCEIFFFLFLFFPIYLVVLPQGLEYSVIIGHFRKMGAIKNNFLQKACEQK